MQQNHKGTINTVKRRLEMSNLAEKYVHIAVGRERINDVLALYEQRIKVRHEAEEIGIVTENSTFPLSIGLMYLSERKNIWILNMKYHNYDEWRADCQDNLWEFQICSDRDTGEQYAVRPFKLPSGKVVCAMFSLLSYNEYDELCSVFGSALYPTMGSLLDMFYMESIVEYENRLYMASDGMFIIGRPLAFPRSAFLFDKQVYHKALNVNKDAPVKVCTEMLFRTMKLSMEWDRKDNSGFVSQVFFQSYI